MSEAAAIFPTRFASWSRRLALFSAQLVVFGIVLHRLLSLPTPVALNLFAAAIALALVAALLALIAFVVIWRQGRSGAWSAAAGLIFSAMILAWPAVFVPVALTHPKIADVTTDPAVPPRFVALARDRAASANPLDYPGAETAELQRAGYPDIKPLVVPRSALETFELVADSVRRLKWKIAAESTPQGRGKPGYIEAVDRTTILGFYDDVVIRVDGNEREARVDIRSTSRYGQHDLGRNAGRIRRFLQELDAQIEASVTGIERPRRRRKTPAEAVPKRQKPGQVSASAQLKSPVRGQPGSQRVQPQKETRRLRAEDQARGKRPRRSEE